MHIVPVGSGQLFLVGHMSLNLLYAIRERKPRHQTASEIIYESTAPAHNCRESPLSICTSPAFKTGLQSEMSIIALHHHTGYAHTHTCMCSPATPTRNEPLCHLGFTPPVPPILTPTELIPGVCFARSATLPTHALTLSVQRRTFSRFLLLLSTPTHSKRL